MLMLQILNRELLGCFGQIGINYSLKMDLCYNEISKIQNIIQLLTIKIYSFTLTHEANTKVEYKV